MTQQALSGVRVLDFTRVLAGPTAAMILGDLGADVIKVEQVTRGDDTREWGPPYVGDPADKISAYFASVNRNKRSLTLNLKHATGREIARQLAAQSHIVLENFKIGQMAAFGLGYEQLRPLQPALVYGSITGFGQTGLYSERPGYDYVIQAMSGLMSITGPQEGNPHKVGVAISDVLTGLFATNGILAALRHAEKTGEGQHLDMALLDAQLAALVNIASNYLVSGQTPPRLGNEHPNIVPYQVFTASDGDFVLAVGNDLQFRKLCQLLQREDLATDERFASNPMRVLNRVSLIAKLEDLFVQQTRAYWIEHCLALGIPCGPIHDVGQALEDAHVQSRGLIQQMQINKDDILRFVGSPIHLSVTPPQVRYAPPTLGQHTDVILRDVLGMDAATIAAYRAEGIV